MTTKKIDSLAQSTPLHKLDNLIYNQYRVTYQVYQGPDDDLASAGLGLSGLASPIPPAFEVGDRPTPGELRRRAVYENYRAIADTTSGGGFGRFFGPGVGFGLESAPPELISGCEVRGVLQDSTSVVVQIPDTFHPQNPTLVLIPASSSRGVYGGILVAEWALQRGYVTVLTDKGGGTGFHILSDGSVFTHDGRCVPRSSTSEPTIFGAPDDPDRLSSFTERHPNRIAAKHAHSTLNVESKWPDYVLESCEFAKTVLSTVWPEEFPHDRCRVIASGFSNGGGASLRAAENDQGGLISGLAVAEPNITPVFDHRFVIQQGSRAPLREHSKSLLEYSSLLNLYQSVASLTLDHEVMAPYLQDAALRRLKALQNKGLWNDLNVAEAAQQARLRIEQAGLLPEQNYLAASHSTVGIYEAMSVCLAYCYGKFRVTDHLFGFSYAAVNEKSFDPRSLSEVEKARLYALSNGLVPTAGVTVINDNSSGGPVQSIHSISPSSGMADQNLDGALNLMGASSGLEPLKSTPLNGLSAVISERVKKGALECKAQGTLNGKPTLIVNGRHDSIIAPNHASRSYLGRHLMMEPEQSQLSYLEIEHAHHLDSLNALPSLAERYVPLTPYLFEALTLLDRHLKTDSALPESQVVRSKPRESGPHGAVPLERANIPTVGMKPSEQDRIRLEEGVLFIPE